VDACEHAHEAEEKLAALIERTHVDAAESKRLRKERDDLLRAIEGLRMERDLAHQECADA
jgi:Spy/CpxP family protein refolding chaperone